MLTFILYLLIACMPLPLYAPTRTEVIVHELYTAHVHGGRVFLYGADFIAYGEVRAGLVVIHWQFDGDEFTTRTKGWPEK